MTQGFLAVPERSIYRLRNATVPAPLLRERPPGVPVSPDGLVVVDVFVRDGLIAAVVAPKRGKARRRASISRAASSGHV